MVHQERNKTESVSLWLNGVKLVITCNLVVIIQRLIVENQESVAIYRDSDSHRQSIHHPARMSHIWNRNFSKNSDLVALGQWFNCKMTWALSNRAFIYKYNQNTTSWHPVESSPLWERDVSQTTYAYWHRVTQIDGNVLTICLCVEIRWQLFANIRHPVWERLQLLWVKLLLFGDFVGLPRCWGCCMLNLWATSWSPHNY